MGHVQTHRFTLKQISEAYDLSQMIAGHFPEPPQFMIAIYELLLNAVEHGNLGISFAEKTELIRQGKWQEEIERRFSLPEHAGKRVKVKLTQDNNQCRLTIFDQGKGFPWKAFVARPLNSRLPNGRGLRIAYNRRFDSIAFNATGNKVTCTAHYQR